MMSTAEILSLISTISYILAGVFLALAVLFWFIFKIPKVIGDLSGRTAKKSIEKMRKANEHTGNKSYRPSSTNAARGKLTDVMTEKQKPQTAKGKAQTAKQVKASTPAANSAMPETGLLGDNKVTAVEVQQTELLQDNTPEEEFDENATVLLEVPPVPVQRTGGKKLTMLTDIMLIHTDEVI